MSFPTVTWSRVLVSTTWVRNSIGFLKGCWLSLRGLHTRVTNERGLHYATLWITTCILLHAFAIDHEDSVFTTQAQFLRKGLKILKQEQQAAQQAGRDNEETAIDVDDDDELTQGKLKCEHLKGVLFTHLNEGDD
jgi:hypothetical protein